MGGTASEPSLPENDGQPARRSGPTGPGPVFNNDEPRFESAAHAKRLCPCRNGASAPYRIDVLSIQAVTMETRREGAAANNRSRL